jgi:CRP/FNR family transcriptional regulator, anaerobic regulatory protein
MKFPPEFNAFQNRLFALGITYQEKDFEILLPFVKTKTFKKGEIFLEKGEICKETYFLTKGMVRSYQTLPNKNEVTFVLCFESHIFTEHSSFVSQKPSTDYLEALEDSTVLSVSYEALNELFKTSHAIESIFRQISDINFVIAKKK